MFLKCAISPDVTEVYINLHFKFSEVQCINEEILENGWLVMFIIILLCFLSLKKNV